MDNEQSKQILKQPLIITAAILGVAIIAGGYLMGNGLVRAKYADRSVTVRGLAEKEVTADLAVWTISYTAQAGNLADAQTDIDKDTAEIRKFFSSLGFDGNSLQPTGANVSQYQNNYGENYTIRQRMSLRTTDIEKAQKAVRQQFDLVRRGVVLEDGSGMSYSYTQLEKIKPEMVATATKDARKAAEQFARDSNTSVGGIKSASQGYFSIDARDGDGGGWGVSDTPYKKVRVVTTIDFYLK